MQGRIEQQRTLSKGVPLVMGILNVTDDSFSDAGDFLDPDAAVARALTMIQEGAGIIDVGPESTRPGAPEVHPSVQIARAIPVIQRIRGCDGSVPISIDTRLASVARAALEAGADMINDVSALRDDPAMVELVAESGAWVCLMHRRGSAATMQLDGGPSYDDVTGEIRDFLCERVAYAVNCGVDRGRIVIDPGIGFGKRVEHNLVILKTLDRFIELGQPVLIGASRKSFLGTVLGIADPKDRTAASLACAAVATMAGVAIIRAHDVASNIQAVRLSAAIRDARC